MAPNNSLQDPPVDMDDTTGSNGGSAKDRFSGDEETDQSEGDNTTRPATSNESRSDSARTDGTGISGSPGDADSSQSEGRSHE